MMAPSCVPATRLDTPGAAISPADIRKILSWRGVIGLGEVMNCAGVLDGDSVVISKSVPPAGG